MFKKLLVPLDRSSLAEQAVATAAAIARATRAGIDFVFVHEPLAFGGLSDAPWHAEQRDDENKYLQSIADEVALSAGVATSHTVLEGDACSTICKRGWDIDADLIVMTSHGRTGFSRAWLGSVADGVLRRSSIPVLMLRPVEGRARRDAPRELFKHILVPLDGSGLSSDVLASAAAIAKCNVARVTLLRVVQPVPAVAPGAALPIGRAPVSRDEAATQLVVEDVSGRLVESARTVRALGADVDAQVVVAEHVAQAILDYSKTHACDLIAMSTRGRGASRLIVGSVADKVLRASALPMLLHRPVGVGIDDDKAKLTSAKPQSLAPA